MWGGSEEQSLSPLWKQFSLKINSFAAGLHENFLPTPRTCPAGERVPRSRGGGPGSHGGLRRKSEGAPGGCKGRDNQGLSLTHSPPPHPPVLESSQGPSVPNTPSELGRCFLRSDLQPPYGRGPGPPTTKENPSQPVGARAVGTWEEDGPGGTPAGHEGGAGAPGAAELVLSSHPVSLDQRLALSLSPRLCLCVSLYFFLPVSPRLYPHFSVLQRLEHAVTKCRRFGFPPAWRLTPSTAGLQVISGDPSAWRRGAGLE